MTFRLFAIWFGRIAVGAVVLLVVAFVSIRGYQRVSDGPAGPLAGGVFRSGELVSEPVEDWSALKGDFEFELVGPGTSRTAGGILLDGEIYISCDLGFMWSRLQPGTTRNLLQVIWWFKDWHYDAEQDGRVRIRKDGRIYPVQIARVQEPRVIDALKDAIEIEAAAFFAPDPIGPRPTEPPNDIWFFRVSQ